MQTLVIQDNLVNFQPLPPGQLLYVVDWNRKPHRNQFIRKGSVQSDIRLPEPIWISETLVTQQLWAAIMGNNPAKFKNDRKPVENISYHDIADFINRLNNVSERRFRLPTESEFIYACTLNYDEHFSEKLADQVWFEKNSNQQTQPVSSKLPGKLSIHDLLGNLYQFVEHDITQVPANKCLYKGACWATEALWVDKDYVMTINKNTRNDTIGFRLVME